MATSLPRLTEADVKRYIPDPYFERGRSYYRNSHVLDTVRRGDHLEGYCEGSEPLPYRIIITLDKQGLVGSACSCPMGGHCKHVVAVLLAWVHQPESFAERQPVDKMLADKTREELIALVQAMLKLEPDLERLVDLPTPGGKGAKRQTKIDPETYRKQIRYAMRDSDPDDWQAASRIAPKIAAVVDFGDGFLDQEDWENAQIVYEAVIDEVLHDYLSTGDEGDIAAEFGRAVQGLGQCLAARAEDPTARRALLRKLFDVIRWNIDNGGLGLGDDAHDLLLENAQPEDHAEIRSWIKAAIEHAAGAEAWSRQWRREAYARLLAAFTDDDEFIRQARQQGLHKPLFDKLIELKRLDEAVQAAQQHLTGSAWERIQAADVLEKVGRAAEALALVKDGLPGNTDDRLPEWLAARYAKRGDVAGALELQFLRWQTRPSLQLFETIEALAKKLQQWLALRPRLLVSLEKGPNSSLLIEIYLHERDWDAAWAAAEKSPWNKQGLRLKVAQAAEKDQPERASLVYLQTAEELIQHKHRSSYVEAIKYLRQVRDLLKGLGRGLEWPQMVANLRERYPTLRAFQEELTKAKL